MKHEIAQAIIQSANRGNLCFRDKFVLRKKTSTSRNLAANTEHPAAIAVEDAETGGLFLQSNIICFSHHFTG